MLNKTPGVPSLGPNLSAVLRRLHRHGHIGSPESPREPPRGLQPSAMPAPFSRPAPHQDAGPAGLPVSSVHPTERATPLTVWVPSRWLRPPRSTPFSLLFLCAECIFLRRARTWCLISFHFCLFFFVFFERNPPERVCACGFQVHRPRRTWCAHRSVPTAQGACGHAQ